MCINESGEILVADNHNNFNITVFTQTGQLLNALESKVKHAQCFDVALMDDNSVVLASKDYRIYVYRWVFAFLKLTFESKVLTNSILFRCAQVPAVAESGAGRRHVWSVLNEPPARTSRLQERGSSRRGKN